MDSDLLRQKTSITGTFCTEDPNSMGGDVKIVFIVDVSGSMAYPDRDPTAVRATAVQNVVNNYILNENYSFAIVSFSDVITDQTNGFTRDMAVLAPAITALDVAGGSTHTYTAVDMARTIIENDVRDIEQSGLRTRNKYVNILLTDGEPNGRTDAEQATWDAIDSLIALKSEPLVGEIVLHATFLAQGGPGDALYDFMWQCAIHGEGDFLQFTNATEISFDSFDYAPIKISFEMINLIATNINARIGRNDAEELTIIPDSDGDGLLDTEEFDFGSDPLIKDTDSDGCDDFMESLRGLNPLENDCACSDPLLDSDRDGLTDCEESILFSDPLYFDTDDDGILDILEVKNSTDPLTNDKYEDLDGDGRANGTEIKLHTNSRINDMELFELKSYKYNIEIEDRTPEGIYCYRVNINNVSLIKTLHCDTEYITEVFDNPPSGDDDDDDDDTEVFDTQAYVKENCKNTIMFYLMQKPQDDSERANLLTIGRYDIKLYGEEGASLETIIHMEDIEFTTE